MTPKERAAMQQALEALEICGTDDMAYIKSEKAITALREALAEPDIEEMTLTQIAAKYEQAEQEPVLCVECGQPVMHIGNKCYACCQKATRELEDALKTAAPVRTKDLTDDEISDVFDSVGSWKETLFGDLPVVFARAVIAKFKEKNK